MAQGGESKSLIIMSKAQGFDPTRIWDPKTQSYGESIAEFNKAPELFTNQAGTGKLPQGTPDSFAEDHPAIGSPQSVPFNIPEGHDVPEKSRATKNSDPFAGMGGTAI